MVDAGRRPHRSPTRWNPHTRRPLSTTSRRLYLVSYMYKRQPRHRGHRPRGHRRRRPRGEHQGDRRPGRQGPCALREGVRRHPEEGLRRLRRPARHRRHHRLHGEAGGPEGHRAEDRLPEGLLRLPDGLRPLGPPVGLRPHRRRLLGRHGRDRRHRRRLRRPQRRVRPRGLPLPLRPAGLHHRQRLLHEGRPDRLHHLAPLRRQRLGR